MAEKTDIKISEAMQQKMVEIQTDAAMQINRIQSEANRSIQQMAEAYILGLGHDLNEGFELAPDLKTIKRR